MNSLSFRKSSALSPDWRRGSAFLLIALTALAGPFFLAIGQADNKPPALSASGSEQSSLTLQKTARNEDVFVIYRDEKGESVCRIATPEEKRRLSRRGEAGATRIIYPGGKRLWMDQFNAAAPAATEFGTPLLPSAGLRIVLHGTQQLENNPTARDAFIVAANRWEALISTPITVVLDVDFGTTIFGQPFPSPSTLGATRATSQTAPLSTVRQQLINNAPGSEELQLYTALPATVPVELNGSTTSASQVRMTLTTSRALGLSPDIPNPDAVILGDGDAGIGFNSAHSFDFNPNDGITAGALDFDAVVVHEIGHALGFISSSGNGNASPVSIWDVFRFRPGTANLGTMATAPRVMSEGGVQVFFNNRTNSFGTTELGLSTGGSDGVGGDGEQSSHWKDDIDTNPFIGIMDPRLRSGRREVLTDNDLKALDTFGYRIGGTAPPPPPPPPAPANDNFAAAVALSGSSGTVIGTNVGATGEAGEPDHAASTSSGRRSVWYNWTAPGSGQATFNTLGSDYDTVLGIYTGGAVNALSLIGANDDVDPAVIVHSTVSFNAVAGTIYRIAVDGYQGETGSITLNWTGPAPGPPTFNISGRMTNQDGSNVVGLQIFLSGSQSAIAITNSNGNYSFANLPAGGNYTVTPSFQGGLISYTPASYSFNNLSADQTANFVRNVEPNFSISGRVTGSDGNGGIVGIPVAITGPPLPGGFPYLPAQTGGNGEFTFTHLAAGGNYTLSSGDSRFVFDPSSVTFNNLSANQFVTFRGSPALIDVHGRILANGIGLPGVTVTFVQQDSGVRLTVETGSDGRYQFAGALLGRRYEVIPSKPGYSFSPTSVFITINQPDLGDMNATLLAAIDVSDFFVRQHYTDFFNRPADSHGLGFWTNNIENCGSNSSCREVKRIDTSAAFFLSIEFQETGYLVYRLYKAAYGDLAGAQFPVRRAEFIPDTRTIGSGVVVTQVGWEQVLEINTQNFLLDFVTRSSFTTAHPTTTTPAQFVDTLFARAGVIPSSTDRQSAVDEFGAAPTSADSAARSRALRRVAENSLLKAQEFNKAFVLMQYFGYLQRNPDDAPDNNLDGYNFWLNKLNQFNGDFRQAEMVKAFITSSEYRGRFGTP